MERENGGYEQVQEWTGINLATLYTLVHQRRIPHIRLGPRLVRFKKSEIESWLAEKAVPLTTPLRRPTADDHTAGAT